jgi:transcription elongation factor GreA
MLHNDDVFLTKDGLQELTDELRNLKEEKLPKLIERVAKARSFGDLSENSEYTNSREDLSFVEGRIEEIEEIISKAKVIQANPSNNEVVSLGSKVTVQLNGKQHVFTVVGEWEADPAEKKISQDSPLGRALIGKRKGEEVQVEAPAGKVNYTILKVH